MKSATRRFHAAEPAVLLILGAAAAPLAAAVRRIALAEAEPVSIPFETLRMLCGFAACAVLSDWFYRRFPERFRLTPYSFGIFAAFATALAGYWSAAPVAGAAVTAAATIAVCRLRPSEKLGDFTPVRFKSSLDRGFVVWCCGWCGNAVFLLDWSSRTDAAIRLLGGLFAAYALYRAARFFAAGKTRPA